MNVGGFNCLSIGNMLDYRVKGHKLLGYITSGKFVTNCEVLTSQEGVCSVTLVYC